ncbi:MAG: hypothetical protein LBE67_08645 [Kocuria palustris]|nr:hypothetical protein [Kocuria palustris]
MEGARGGGLDDLPVIEQPPRGPARPSGRAGTLPARGPRSPGLGPRPGRPCPGRPLSARRMRAKSLCAAAPAGTDDESCTEPAARTASQLGSLCAERGQVAATRRGAGQSRCWAEDLRSSASPPTKDPVASSASTSR